MGVLQARSWLPRTRGSVRLGFVRGGGETRLATLRQSGAARVRFPKPAGGAMPEAVLLNTAGGLTGGDRMDIEVTLAAQCQPTSLSPGIALQASLRCPCDRHQSAPPPY